MVFSIFRVITRSRVWPSDSRRSLNFKYCISVGRDIHVDVDIQVSKLQELVHGLWTRQWISVQRRNYAYT